MLEQSVFVRSSTLDGAIEVASASGTALASHERLAPILAARLSARAAGLFARPAVVHGNGAAETNISWYVSRIGVIRPWGDLTPSEQTEVGASVAGALNEIKPLLGDPSIGPDLVNWLNVPSLNNDLILVGTEPHFVNWGLLPADIALDPSARAEHFRNTFGRFGLSADGAALPLPSLQPPAFYLPGAATAQPAAGNAIGVALAAVAPRAPWIPIAIATAIAAVLLLLLPFVLLTPQSGMPAAVKDGIGRQADGALRQRITELQQELSANSCRAPAGGPAALPPAGRLLPSAPAMPIPPRNPLVPGQRSAAPIEQSADGPHQQASAERPAIVVPESPTSDLVKQLDDVTALVVVMTSGAVSTGTAFFVNERQLVTNRHVIEKAEGNDVLVASRAFGTVISARIVAKTVDNKFGSPDFAVLEVEGFNSSQTLALAKGAERLQSVIAAGFPGFVMETDQDFRKLQRGDASSIPLSAVTQGSVVALQKGNDAMSLVAHTAPISPGNSGGPLVDQCGRAVGVNTFIRADQESVTRLSFALSADNLRTFLDQNRISYRKADETCAPPMRQAVAPPVAASPVAATVPDTHDLAHPSPPLAAPVAVPAAK